MTEIVYMTQGDATMPRLNETVVRDWIVAVAATLNQKVGCLTYVFCDDEYILQTNREFLGHDYYTDIITFYYTNSRHIAGDMVISLDTVRSNAFCTCAASMTRDLVSAKSWKNTRMKRWLFCLKTCF